MGCVPVEISHRRPQAGPARRRIDTLATPSNLWKAGIAMILSGELTSTKKALRYWALGLLVISFCANVKPSLTPGGDQQQLQQQEVLVHG
ncbi:hypothetical protein Pan97_12270 [Bremerella volcania]|uniref:Uncharacterized protein n=1 Tax=Bremerella volcania TaxID=2527984 RepID=A0A518C4Q7_9BACT|nr:hypothetical protein Pan97_12270 [Bremerella volcania]